MLTIRKEQLAAFGKPALKAFEGHVVVHVKKYFPGECEKLGAEKVQEFVQFGTQKAATYGIVAERDVCKYIDFMMVYGREFDVDPKLPWASSILKKQTLKNSTTKIDHLYKAAKRHKPAEVAAPAGR